MDTKTNKEIKKEDFAKSEFVPDGYITQEEGFF